MGIENDKQDILESNNITQSILTLSLPMMLSGFVDALYNTVDSIFVGRFIGDYALAALSINNVIQIFLLGFGNLFGVGITSIISRALGAKNQEKIENTLINGTLLALCSTVIISWSTLFFLDSVLRFIGSPENILYYSRNYGQIILWTGFLSPLNAILLGVLRVKGLVKEVMKLVVLGAITNIILDALFIILFKWGVRGAALATIFAQGLVCFLTFKKVSKAYRVHFHLHYLKNLNLTLVGEILSIGVTNFLRISTFAIMGIVANRTLTNYGSSAIAAFGVVNRILHLAYQPIFGSNLGVQSLIGYNYGANKFLKVKSIILKAYSFATLLGLIPSIILIIGPDFLFSVFTESKEILFYTKQAARVAGATFFLYGFQIFSMGSLLAMGHPKEALILSILRPCLMVLCVSILPKFIGVFGVWMAFPITDIVSTILTIIVMLKELSLLKKREDMRKNLL